LKYRLILTAPNFLFYLFILLFLLAGCTGKESRRENSSVSEDENAVIVETTKAKREKIVPQLSSFGNISFKSKTDISSAVNGIVKKAYKDVGDKVIPGMVLALIENIQLQIEEKRAQAEIQSAEAALSLSKARFSEGKLQVKARLLNLEKKKFQIDQKKTELDELKKIIKNKEELLKVDGITREKLNELKLQYKSGLAAYNMLLKDYEIAGIGLTDEDISEALQDDTVRKSAGAEREKLLILLNTRTLQAGVKVAEARLKTAKTKLSSVQTLLTELEVKSDFYGIIGARYVEEGERIKEGTKLFTTFDSSTVYAVFPLQESKAGFLSRGQLVKITVPALGNKVFRGKVDIISPTIDSRSGNINVKALMINRSEKLLPGMFVKVSVITGNPVSKLLIPVSAIVKKQAGNAKVFTVVNSRAFLKQIKVGEEERTGPAGTAGAQSTKGDSMALGTVNGADGSAGGQAGSGGSAVTGNAAERIEVKDGLNEGDTVIVKPPPVLREGMLVKYRRGSGK